jgi:hypothetical protein
MEQTGLNPLIDNEMIAGAETTIGAVILSLTHKANLNIILSQKSNIL